MVRVRIERHGKSFDYKNDPGKPDSFENNWKNNSLDWIVLLKDTAEIARFKCQSVANYCFGDQLPGDSLPHGDSLLAGSFGIRAFVDPRKFHGEIHGIVNALDLDGQVIDAQSMQYTKNGFQTGRWLIHDRYSEKIKDDTRYAWSAGCIILSSRDLESFNYLLRAFQVVPGRIIPAELIEL